MQTFKKLISLLFCFNLLVSCNDKEIVYTFPVFEISSIDDVSDTSIKCSTDIISDGNHEIIKKGVVWSTNNRPKISMNMTDEGKGSNNFTSEITGLIQTGVYYVRPYLRTNSTTYYGDTIQVQTKEGDGKQVIDYDGNIYNTIEIGGQTWLKENSFAVNFQNGDPVYPTKQSFNFHDPMLDEPLDAEFSIKNTKDLNYYGSTFTWEKVIDERKICPKGWHPANDDDWYQLVQYLGGVNIAGGKMKEEGTEHWHIPNVGATDEIGFTALPSGYNQSVYVGLYAYWWSATEMDSTYAYGYMIKYDSINFFPIYADKRVGFTVRCVKDE